MWIKLGRNYQEPMVGRHTVSGVRVAALPSGKSATSCTLRVAIGEDVAKKIGIVDGTPILVSAKTTDDKSVPDGRIRLTKSSTGEKTCTARKPAGGKQVLCVFAFPKYFRGGQTEAKWTIKEKGLYIELPFATKRAVKEDDIGEAEVKKLLSTSGARKKRKNSPATLATYRRNAAMARQKKAEKLMRERLMLELKDNPSLLAKVGLSAGSTKSDADKETAIER